MSDSNGCETSGSRNHASFTRLWCIKAMSCGGAHRDPELHMVNKQPRVCVFFENALSNCKQLLAEFVTEFPSHLVKA
jgi:hypothetical protein